MDVDKSNESARNINQKKREMEIEEQRQQLEMNRVQRERKKNIEAEREKGEKEVVEISKAANNQMDQLKKLNSERVQALNVSQQKNYEDLAGKTAEDLKRLQGESVKVINDHKAGTMEKIRNVTDKGDDPFYKMKSMNPVLAENDKDYTIKVNLPEHEAKHVFVAAEGPYIKLSLSRRFQDNLKNEEEKRTTLTNSFQSVVEQVAMPGAYDAKKIERSYADGVLTIKAPKVIFGDSGKKLTEI
jgi:HSP20 family molecular chaperone IbpA